MIRVLSVDRVMISLERDASVELPEGIQAFAVSMAISQSAAEHHILVTAYYPVLQPAACHAIEEQLRRRGEEARISFFIGDAPGKASVSISTASSGPEKLNVAAATAVVKTSCGWDESDYIRVTVNDEDFALYTRCDGEHWTVFDSKP